METLEERIRQALSSNGEELWKYVKDPHPQIAIHTTGNRNLTEEMAVFIAKKRTAPAQALGILAGDIRFRDSYKLRLAICRNPRTPQSVTFSILKFLHIFDLGDLTKDQTVPVAVRQKSEMLLLEKIPYMPSGIKKALSRRASSTIILSIMERGDRSVILNCLNSHMITESHICALINKATVNPLVVMVVAEHRKWSVRYSIRYALIMNNFTPMVQVAEYIPGMKTRDLRELYANSDLPGSAKPFIYSELKQRGISIEDPQEEVYEIDDDLYN